VTVFRKTNLWPYIMRQPVTYLEELLSFKHSVRRSGITWFLFTKFSKFFYEGSYVKIFGGIISWPKWILYLKGNLLSLDISWVLKMPFLTDFAIWKFVSFELLYLEISAVGGLYPICLTWNELFYLILCTGSWEILFWLLTQHFVLNNAYHVRVSARSGYASFCLRN